MREMGGWLGWLARMAPLLMLLGCVSVNRTEPQVVIGRVSVSHFDASEEIGTGRLTHVYEVRPQEGPDATIFIIESARCPFDVDDPEGNDPDQLYRIEYVNSPRSAHALFRAPRTNLFVTKCEKV